MSTITINGEMHFVCTNCGKHLGAILSHEVDRIAECDDKGMYVCKKGYGCNKAEDDTTSINFKKENKMNDTYRGFNIYTNGSFGYYAYHGEQQRGVFGRYLIGDGTIAPNMHSGTPKSGYRHTVEDIKKLIDLYHLKKAAQERGAQVAEQKGIVITVERFMQDGVKMVRITNINALTKDKLPKEYVNGSPAVYATFGDIRYRRWHSRWLDSYESAPTAFSFLYIDQELTVEEYKEKMRYIAKAGHRLAEIKELNKRSIKLPLAKKQRAWSGTRVVKF